MRICFVSFYIYPLLDPKVEVSVGGAEIQIFNLASYMRRIGHEVSIVVADFGQPDGQVHDGIRLVKAFKPGRNGRLGKIRSKLQLFSALSRSRADLYVASGASPDIGLIALYCRLRGKKFVFRTAHEFDCDGRNEAGGLPGQLYGRGLRCADAVVTQHHGHRDLLSRRGIASEVIRNAFAITEPGRGARDIDALWVARCEPWKNPGKFLDLAEAFPGQCFVMICPREPHQAELFDRIEARAGSLSNLRFVEKVPFEETTAFFDRARVFVGTSDFEGFPNTYLQACLSGTPILSYKVDPDGFIARQGAGLVAGGDDEAMVDGLVRLLDDPEEWRRRAASAWNYVRETHDIETQGARWASLFDRVAGGRAEPGQ
ncbi:MAG TPA: glycosyltransferase family 4 protein [Allosphingosinicella sp.]|jgi:glycosyltransferase involved in cell wall biosynthesis